MIKGMDQNDVNKVVNTIKDLTGDKNTQNILNTLNEMASKIKLDSQLNSKLIDLVSIMSGLNQNGNSNKNIPLDQINSIINLMNKENQQTMNNQNTNQGPEQLAQSLVRLINEMSSGKVPINEAFQSAGNALIMFLNNLNSNINQTLMDPNDMRQETIANHLAYLNHIY
jgi:hypothetical protein